MQTISNTIESYLISIITKHLKKYTTNYDNLQAVELSLWEGEGKLKGLDLDVVAINEEMAGAPLELIEGRLDQLSIKVQWASIYSKPVQIFVEGLTVTFRVKTIDEVLTSLSSKKSAKKNKAKASTSSEMGGGWAASMGVKISSNLHVSCKEATIVLVDNDFRFRVHLGIIEMQPANAKWAPEYNKVSSKELTIRQLISVYEVHVYLGSPPNVDMFVIGTTWKCTAKLSRDLISTDHFGASSTRIGINSRRIRISVSAEQVPLLIKFGHVLDRLCFIQDEILNPPQYFQKEDQSRLSRAVSWVLDWVPVVPVAYPIGRITNRTTAPPSEILHIGVYANRIDVRLRIPGSENDDIEAVLGGVLSEITIIDFYRMRCFSGISLIDVFPTELPREMFVSSGVIPETFLSESLYERMDEDFLLTTWAERLEILTPETMNERAQSVAVDVLQDVIADKETGKAKATSLVRIVVGQPKIHYSLRMASLLTKLSNIFCSLDPELLARPSYRGQSAVNEEYQFFVLGATVQGI